eukprot:3652811-Amphidinium_carterae.1
MRRPSIEMRVGGHVNTVQWLCSAVSIRRGAGACLPDSQKEKTLESVIWETASKSLLTFLLFGAMSLLHSVTKLQGL